MTKSLNDNTKIALIQKDVSYIQKDISDIKTVLREGYATKDALVEVAKDTERRFQLLEAAVIELKAAGNLWRWLNPLLAALLGSVLTFLLIQYIMGLK